MTKKNTTACDMCKEEQIHGDFWLHSDGIQLFRPQLLNWAWHRLSNLDFCPKCIKNKIAPWLIENGCKL